MSACTFKTLEISLKLSLSEIYAYFLFNKHSKQNLHEFKLHNVIYNISQFKEKLKILLKNILILML